MEFNLRSVVVIWYNQFSVPTVNDASSILVRSKNEGATEFKIGVSQQSTRRRRTPEPVYYNKLHSFNVLYIVIHLCFCCCCFSRSIRLNWLKRQIRRGCRRVGLGSLADDPHQPIYYYYEYYWSIEMRIETIASNQIHTKKTPIGFLE